MDLNYILFIVAILNLGGDLYNAWRFRARLPRWIPATVVGCFSTCVLSWFVANDVAGFFSAFVLILYLLSMRSFTKRSRPPRLPTPITWSLIALSCTGFGIQLLYGATFDMERIVSLGALYSPMFHDGDWWRLFTAQFLHLGILHLGCNMLGLIFLGPIVERTYGTATYVIGYFLSGTGGMLLAMCLYSAGQGSEEVVLVGASANILGLVGLAAAAALFRYRATGCLEARMQLGTMVQIALLQIIFDSLVPEVSSTAHVGGAVTGFIFGAAARGLHPITEQYEAD